jgi:hypothetical protein
MGQAIGRGFPRPIGPKCNGLSPAESLRRVTSRIGESSATRTVADCLPPVAEPLTQPRNPVGHFGRVGVSRPGRMPLLVRSKTGEHFAE